MAILSEDLKRMLIGLAYQDAGDFLSIREKMKVLGKDSENLEKTNTQSPLFEPRIVESRAATKRIAFISNGRISGAPLDYAIDACLRQNARIDLLIHGAVDSECTPALEKRIKNSGLVYQRIKLEVNAVDSIVDYINKHPSLIYLIARSDDDVARVVIEEVLPRRRTHVQIPFVLIEDHLAASLAEQSAA